MTYFESTRHASKAASDHAAIAIERAPRDRDEARRYFKREAGRADRRFEAATDETCRVFEACYASRMRREAEDRA